MTSLLGDLRIPMYSIVEFGCPVTETPSHFLVVGCLNRRPVSLCSFPKPHKTRPETVNDYIGNSFMKFGELVTKGKDILSLYHRRNYPPTFLIYSIIYSYYTVYLRELVINNSSSGNN